MSILLKFKKIAALLLLANVYSGTALADPLIDSARRALMAGKAFEAHQLLQAAEFDRAGDPDFDYLFGISALEAGHASQATLAFERVLLVTPAHRGARLDLGRAYYAMGDLDRAEAEFETVARWDPPPAARATLEHYRAAIAEHRAHTRGRIDGYAEAGIGYDSNINQATSGNSLYLPVFGSQFDLSSGARRSGERYAQFGGGLSGARRLNESVRLLGAVDLRLRDYHANSRYDYSSADVRVGLEKSLPNAQLRLQAGYNDHRLESDRYRTLSSVSAEWRQRLGERDVLSANGQFAQARYIDAALNANDTDLWLLGLGWTHVLDPQTALALTASLFGGREVEDNRRADGDKDMLGGRFGLQGRMWTSVDWFASAGIQVGRFQREHALFLTRREDWLLDVAAGVSWSFRPGWSLRPQAQYLRSDSNIKVYDYQRYDLGVSVRHDF